MFAYVVVYFLYDFLVNYAILFMPVIRSVFCCSLFLWLV